MVLEALRGYVELASGLTEVNRQKAVAEAKALLAQGGAFEQTLSEQAKGFADDIGKQVQSLADDLMATSRANRQILTTLIRSEAERAVGSLGLATAEEISALRRQVERLDRKVAGTTEPPTGAKKTSSKAAKKPAAKTATTSAAKPATKTADQPKPDPETSPRNEP